YSEEVGCRAPVVHARGLGSQIIPAFQATVAPAEPGQGDEIDLFVFAHGFDKRHEFLVDRSSGRSSSTSTMRSSAGLDPSSSELVSASLRSNSRAFSTTKQIFSVEIDSVGIASAIFAPQRPSFGR